MESYIINLIKTNPEWRKELEILNIKVKEDRDLAIFNYGINADFTNPIVREARGIIIDTKELEVRCWPFEKFCSIGQRGVELDLDNFNWNNCRVEDKLDGSIIKLWFFPAKVVLDWLTPEPQGYWVWSTNSCIYAKDADIQNSDKTYLDIIKSAINYTDVPFNWLDINKTYIFELVSPQTQVVVKYPYPMLYHIGTRDNKTGEEYRVDIGVKRPDIYDIHSLDDCIKAATNLNSGGTIKKEGFVVVDNNWHRVKIKSPDYLRAHYLWNNGNVSKDKILNLIIKDEIGDISEYNSKMKVLIKYYDYALEELKYKINSYMDYARGLYEEFGHDRKALASVIKYHPLSGFGFKAVETDSTAEELLSKMPISGVSKLINTYSYREDWF